MTGIIINDSIVLVTTIDEHARERGLIPAIIEGTADRLRAVFLTTATTLLGLGPLLYEGSAQAQFLKPTVITLVYGLGFGMVLVLAIVPAFLAMQLDVGRLIDALRRALRYRVRNVQVRAAVTVAVLGGFALFSLTMIPALVQDVTPPLVAALLPRLAGLPSVVAGLAGFAMGMLALVIAVYLMTALWRGFTVRARRTG